ncbi:hypothetical protein P7K49_028009, partial [Saguinus oedipus]
MKPLASQCLHLHSQLSLEEQPARSLGSSELVIPLHSVPPSPEFGESCSSAAYAADPMVQEGWVSCAQDLQPQADNYNADGINGQQLHRTSRADGAAAKDAGGAHGR